MTGVNKSCERHLCSIPALACTLAFYKPQPLVHSDCQSNCSPRSLLTSLCSQGSIQSKEPLCLPFTLDCVNMLGIRFQFPLLHFSPVSHWSHAKNDNVKVERQSESALCVCVEGCAYVSFSCAKIAGQVSARLQSKSSVKHHLICAFLIVCVSVCINESVVLSGFGHPPLLPTSVIEM